MLGGFSSAFFLYGIALIYGATGSTNMAQIFNFLGSTELQDKGLLFTGMALLLVGFGFKVAAVPFHMWTPDVYQGAPTPITGFMASASKAAAFAALLRVISIVFIAYRDDWRPVIFALAVLSLLVGAVMAIVQTDVKRMLAYSSITHAGFILVGVEAMGDQRGQTLVRSGYSSALFYLLAYAVIVLGSFGVVMLVARRATATPRSTPSGACRTAARCSPSRSPCCCWPRPACRSPPGFVAKFDVILAAVDARSYVLAVLAMLSAVIAAFLYLRIIVTMYMGDDADETAPVIRVPASAAVGLALTLAFTVVVGFLPGLVVDFARDAAGTLAL